MQAQTSIKINKSTGEIEISGTEAFVTGHIGLIESILGLYQAETNEAPAAEEVVIEAQTIAAPAPVEEPVAVEAPAKKAVGAPKKAEKAVAAVAKKEAPVAAVAEAPVRVPGTRGRKPGSTNKPKVAVAAPVQEVKAVEAPVAKPRVLKGSPAKAKKAALQAEVEEDKKPRLKTKQTFKEYYESFPNKTKKGDLILIAGYFHQRNSPDGMFSTFKASKLLKELDIKLTNPSQYVKNNIQARRLKIMDKSRYQVTAVGIEYLRVMLNK